MADGSVTGDVRWRQMLADCEQYLKDGGTPAQRIERERRDTEAVLNLLIREAQNERMREALQLYHRAALSSEWPERCRSNMLARNVCWFRGLTPANPGAAVGCRWMSEVGLDARGI